MMVSSLLFEFRIGDRLKILLLIDSKLDERDAQSRSCSREKLEEKANETSTEESVGEEGKAIGTTSHSPYNLDFDRFDYKQQVISFPGNYWTLHS